MDPCRDQYEVVSFEKQIEHLRKVVRRIEKKFETQKKKAVFKCAKEIKKAIIWDVRKKLIGKKARISGISHGSNKNNKVLVVMKVDKIKLSADSDVLFEIYGSSPYTVKYNRSDLNTKCHIEVTENVLVEIIS